ncbi:hypothetical protein JAMGFMIE_02549 [Rheinheimera sp. MM224]|nr:hypothetical protein JAMGFMIE_02549 [Rheinheimera sp. MM224]
MKRKAIEKQYLNLRRTQVEGPWLVPALPSVPWYFRVTSRYHKTGGNKPHPYSFELKLIPKVIDVATRRRVGALFIRARPGKTNMD